MTANNDNSYCASKRFSRRRELRGLCLCCFVVLALLIALATNGKGATIPAGTVLTVRTLTPVCAIDLPGTPVPAELEYPVAVNGKILLPAGTYFSGKVVTSKRLTNSTNRLTVNLSLVRVNGREVPLTTTGPVWLRNNFNIGPSSIKVNLADETIAASKRVQFQLARPLII